ERVEVPITGEGRGRGPHALRAAAAALVLTGRGLSTDVAIRRVAHHACSSDADLGHVTGLERPARRAVICRGQRAPQLRVADTLHARAISWTWRRWQVLATCDGVANVDSARVAVVARPRNADAAPCLATASDDTHRVWVAGRAVVELSLDAGRSF